MPEFFKAYLEFLQEKANVSKHFNPDLIKSK